MIYSLVCGRMWYVVVASYIPLTSHLVGIHLVSRLSLHRPPPPSQRRFVAKLLWHIRSKISVDGKKKKNDNNPDRLHCDHLTAPPT